MYNFDNKGKRLYESRVQWLGENTWEIPINVLLLTMVELEDPNTVL